MNMYPSQVSLPRTPEHLLVVISSIRRGGVDRWWVDVGDDVGGSVWSRGGDVMARRGFGCGAAGSVEGWSESCRRWPVKWERKKGASVYSVLKGCHYLLEKLQRSGRDPAPGPQHQHITTKTITKGDGMGREDILRNNLARIKFNKWEELTGELM
ncbi:hypothetical protein Tco_0329360 [Tanacetum coccineum]